jgi:hypothetical protein
MIPQLSIAPIVAYDPKNLNTFVVEGGKGKYI